MALPTKIYLDGEEFIIYRHQFSGGYKTKAMTNETTISGKRSRQFAWNPIDWTFTVWLKPENKVLLDTIWEDDGSDITALHNLQIDDAATYTYTVTLDEYELKPHEAVCERWLADLTIRQAWL